MIAHRFIGTSAFGIRAPIVREGDDLVQVVVSSVIEAQQQNEFQLRDHDGITLRLKQVPLTRSDSCQAI